MSQTVLKRGKAVLTAEQVEERDAIEWRMRQCEPAAYEFFSCLAEIQEKGLHLDCGRSIYDYMRERWPRWAAVASRATTYRMIKYVRTTAELEQSQNGDSVDIATLKKSHIQELSYVPKDMRERVIEETYRTSANGKPTATDFRRAYDHLRKAQAGPAQTNGASAPERRQQSTRRGAARPSRAERKANEERARRAGNKYLRSAQRLGWDIEEAVEFLRELAE